MSAQPRAAAAAGGAAGGSGGRGTNGSNGIKPLDCRHNKNYGFPSDVELEIPLLQLRPEPEDLSTVLGHGWPFSQNPSQGWWSWK